MYAYVVVHLYGHMCTRTESPDPAMLGAMCSDGAVKGARSTVDVANFHKSSIAAERCSCQEPGNLEGTGTRKRDLDFGICARVKTPYRGR